METNNEPVDSVRTKRKRTQQSSGLGFALAFALALALGLGVVLVRPVHDSRPDAPLTWSAPRPKYLDMPFKGLPGDRLNRPPTGHAASTAD